MPASERSRRRPPARGPAHLTIECVTPELDGGRHAVKRVVGDEVRVGADVIKDGHDVLAAHIVVRPPASGAVQLLPMRFDYNSDRWQGEFVVDVVGRWTFTVEAWTDTWATWLAGFRKKVDAGVDVRIELLEAAQLTTAAARRARSAAERATLTQTARVFQSGKRNDAAIRRALDSEVEALLRRHLQPSDLTRYDRELAVVVDRQRARFASWYEFFPRSTGSNGSHGTFATAAAALPRIQRLGFDVVYLPPIHPIGRSFRKGKNNSLTPGADDVGSPWAIGSEEGGHDAVHPQLGTLADFDRFVAAARALGMDVALDYALQCAPDHPWVKQHPEWFHRRPDGTIAYAENPPKKYQDIYPINFWCDTREALWNACRDVLLHWIRHGVTTFRVDNPHTKPLAFWEWIIADIKARHPEVIFFAEAFTRPKRMQLLAKIGFTMSYTYFTWKNSAWDLREHIGHITSAQVSEYFRGNLFTNTPDILNDYLVRGGRPAFRSRLVLAATLSSLYGIYSGFELIENVPVREGSEEYLDSEKYELRPRDWKGEGTDEANIEADVVLLNRIRTETPALQRYSNLTFHHSENEQVLFYRKAGAGTDAEPRLSGADAGSDPDVLVVVNLDPAAAQATMVHVPIADMGITADEPYVVHDLLSDARFTWRGERNYVRLDPALQPAHVLRVERVPAETVA